MNMLQALSERHISSSADVLSTPPTKAGSRKRSREVPQATPPTISQSDERTLIKRANLPKLVIGPPSSSCSPSMKQFEPVLSSPAPCRTSRGGKSFSCPVHGMVYLEKICVDIIDSPPFQRLHNLKQLGTSDYVFRGATHTRFEHSVGVAHLAEQMTYAIKKNQPHLGITDIDVLCVKIAGLCHDLGHGPFSHVFDGVFIKQCRPDIRWRHEDGSVNMLRYIISTKGIQLADHGMSETDLTFIEEMISGTPETERKGRPFSKSYLYDIVNNTRSGLDVDKIDYFERDMKMTNVAGSITAKGDFSRFLTLGVVMPAVPLDPSLSSTKTASSPLCEMPLMICYPEKLVKEAVSLFQARFQMHQRVYTHKVVKQVEFMITDALILADPYIMIPGAHTPSHPTGDYKMSECIEDMEAFSRLNDSILDVIALARAPPGVPEGDLLKAKALIERIRNRDLYTCVGQTAFSSGDSISLMTEAEIKDEILAYDNCNTGSDVLSNIFEIGQDSIKDEGSSKTLQRKNSLKIATLDPDDVIVEKMHIHHGLKSRNPVNRLRFFPKRMSNRNDSQECVFGRKIEEEKYAFILPRTFEDRAVRVFCRSVDKSESVRRAFDAWCTRMNAHSPFPSASFPPEEDHDEYNEREI